MRAFAFAMTVIAAAVIAHVPASAAEDGRIGVIGRARIETQPDFAEVEIGIESRGRTPAIALDGASNAAAGIIGTAKALGVGEADLGTSSVTLAPQTRQVRQPDGTVREQSEGYVASNRVRVRLADMGRLGELMRRALDSGANRIEGVTFGLSDPAAAQAGVQVAAMKDARAQAGRLAEAAGVKLGATLSIASPPRNAASGPLPFALARAKGAPGRASVPLEAGTIESSAEVEAVFAIVP